MWNAAGGIVWAIVYGTVAYYFGRSVADAIGEYGVYAAIVLGVAALVVGGVFYFRRRRARS